MPEQQPDLIPVESTGESRSSDVQREVYRQRLRAALRDPQFRRIPGFPLADDEAILALSDPPYYTACPNPFLGEIVAQWQAERDALPPLPSWSSKGHGARRTSGDDNGYHREPFAADVSEGKNNPIYNAHSYHTKVPHPAVMRYILHYTDPGDIVLDGFCGAGMTGVAAQLCGDADEVRRLGYRVDADGVIWDHDRPISRLGARKAVLVDLSPAATFIAYNYNAPVDAVAFAREARRILREVEEECGWMYETWHVLPSLAGWEEKRVKGKINYTVWSDIFLCPACGAEMVFWDVAVDHEDGRVRDDWRCPACGVLLSKSPARGSGALRVERAFETRFDRALGQSVRMARQAPVLINYSVGNRRYEKRPDADDLALLEKIEQAEIPYPFPTEPFMFKGENWGDTWRAGIHAGLTHVHHFYTRRNLWALAAIYAKSRDSLTSLVISLLFAFQQLVMGMSKWARYVPSHYSQVNQGLSGTLYIASQVVEVSPEYIIANKISRLASLWLSLDLQRAVTISCQSASQLQIEENSIDYIFVDPPFGANLMYSELNFLWEAWLGVFTNNAPEAVINQTQRKGLPEYQALMEACFREFYRVLKPGRWMTVEFHNSQNAVWNSIQEALLRAGFMVADVRTSISNRAPSSRSRPPPPSSRIWSSRLTSPPPPSSAPFSCRPARSRAPGPSSVSTWRNCRSSCARTISSNRSSSACPTCSSIAWSPSISSAG